MSDNVQERILEMIREARELREARARELAAQAVEFSLLHGYGTQTAEGKLLATVIEAGACYEDVINSIMQSKKERLKREH